MARRIGQILIDLGFIDEDQLEVILEEQLQQPGEQLGKVAEDMGLSSYVRRSLSNSICRWSTSPKLSSA